MELNVKSFIKTSIFLLLFIAIIFFVVDFFIYFMAIKYYSQFALVLLMLLILILIINSFTLILIINTYKTKYISNFFNRYIHVFMSITYPFLHIIGKVFKIDGGQLKSFFIEINNILVKSKKYKVNPSKILILTPHCLQNSECEIKITNNPNKCKRCGKCNIKDLLEISEKYGTSFYVASGGTFARKIVSDLKPKFIVSVACERDLLSGIQDVKIPVIGVVNERPNGPCYNTRVDVEKLKQAIEEIICPN